MACAEGKVARLRELLAMLSFEGVQELLFCADWAEETSLLKMASGQGHLEIVKLLVACGANPNDDGADDDDPDPDSTRKAPLHMAAACGHTDVVRWLVREGGADARQLDRNGCNAYHPSRARPPRRDTYVNFRTPTWSTSWWRRSAST